MDIAIEDCKAACKKPDQADTPEERFRLIAQTSGAISTKNTTTQIVNGQPVITCPAGYQHLRRNENIVDELIAYLNVDYKKRQEEATQNQCVNYAAIIYNFLRANGLPHNAIPACIAAEAVPLLPSGLAQEQATEADCRIYEVSGLKQFFIRVLPDVPGKFFRPKVAVQRKTVNTVQWTLKAQG